MTRNSEEYKDPCTEDREISAFERNLILGVAVLFRPAGRRWGRCDPDRCQNTELYRFEIGGKHEVVEGCPHRFITSKTREYLDLYAHYKAGLPVQGGHNVLEQPAEYLQAMRIIGSAYADMEEAEIERKRKAAQNGNR